MATPPLAVRSRVPPESLRTVPSEYRPCDWCERVGLTADDERVAAQPQVLGRSSSAVYSSSETRVATVYATPAGLAPCHRCQYEKGMDRIAVSAESKIRFVVSLRVGRGTKAHGSRLTIPASLTATEVLPTATPRPVAGAAQQVAGPGQRAVPNSIVSGALAGGPSGSAIVRLTPEVRDLELCGPWRIRKKRF